MRIRAEKWKVTEYWELERWPYPKTIQESLECIKLQINNNTQGNVTNVKLTRRQITLLLFHTFAPTNVQK